MSALQIDATAWIEPDTRIVVRDLGLGGSRVEVGEAIEGRMTLFAARAQLVRLRDALTAALDATADGGASS